MRVAGQYDSLLEQQQRFIRSLEKDGRLNRALEFLPDMGPLEIAFAGRSNVGKSSLINTLVNRKKLVQTSSTPGKTRLINFFRVNDALMLVDLPGYGYARVSEAERQKWRPMVEQYLSGRKTLKAVIVILDARREPGKTDTQLLGWLARIGIPRIITVTKCDKLSKTALAKQMGVIAQGLAVPHEELVLFSAKSHQGRDVLWRAISNLMAS